MHCLSRRGVRRAALSKDAPILRPAHAVGRIQSEPVLGGLVAPAIAGAVAELTGVRLPAMHVEVIQTDNHPIGPVRWHHQYIRMPAEQDDRLPASAYSGLDEKSQCNQTELPFKKNGTSFQKIRKISS